MNRRQALGKGAAVAIGVGVVVVGAAGYLAYISSQGPGTTTATTTATSSAASSSSSSSASSTLLTSSTTAQTSSTASQTGTGTYTSTFTGTYSGGTETTSDTWVYNWPTPTKQIQQDVWAFRPDLVQIGVNRYMEQMNENVKLSTISQDYFSVVTTKLLSGDLDLAYNTTDGAGTAYASGLIHDMNDVKADYPNGRILYGVDQIKAAISYPTFVQTYTTLDGKHYYGLPYYQTNMGALMTNSKLTVQAGLESASDYTKNSWPQSYSDLWGQLPSLQSKGIAQTPLLPGMWFTVFPGFGISQEFDAEMINIYGWNSLFTDPPTPTPTFDTNTSMADLLKQWKALWNANLVPHGIITMNSESDVNGLFGSGQFVYGLWISYDIRPMQNPKNSKIAGYIHPIPGGKTGFGYLIQQGFIIREISDPVYAERVHALADWMAYKDRAGVYYEPLRIAAEADIAGLTAYQDANTGPEIQSAFKDALVDPTHEVAVMANQVQTGAYFKAAPAAWANNWQIAVTDNVPSFLSGTQDLNTTITKMRTKADALVKGT